MDSQHLQRIEEGQGWDAKGVTLAALFCFCFCPFCNRFETQVITEKLFDQSYIKKID
jgi:hypothetical protein